MKHFVDPATEMIYAYEPDGSQDHLIDPSFVPIEGAELEALREKQLQELLAKQKAEQEALSPEQKLSQFLASNPDVLKLISGQA